MKTEAEILIEALGRIQSEDIISDLEVNYSVDGGGDISYYAPDRLGYYPTFKFDKEGRIVHAGVTV